MFDVDALRKVSVFGALSREEVGMVRAMLEERTFDAGTTVVREGEPGRELYIIEEGTAEVLKKAAGGQDVRIAELEPGAVFGEMALVGILPRAASVRAKTPLRALVLPYQKVTSLSKDHLQTFTVLIMNLARDICRRLYSADSVLGEFNIARSDAKPRG
jgi:CRP-like cAMP-binding protein